MSEARRIKVTGRNQWVVQVSPPGQGNADDRHSQQGRREKIVEDWENQATGQGPKGRVSHA